MARWETSSSSERISGATVGTGKPAKDRVRLARGLSVRVDVGCWAGRNGRRRLEGASERCNRQHKFNIILQVAYLILDRLWGLVGIVLGSDTAGNTAVLVDKGPLRGCARRGRRLSSHGPAYCELAFTIENMLTSTARSLLGQPVRAGQLWQRASPWEWGHGGGN